MKGLKFMASRRAFPALRITPLGLRRLLQRGGERERPKASALIFSKIGFFSPTVCASVLIKERLFNRAERFTQKSSREIQKISTLLCQTVHKSRERRYFFGAKSRIIKENFRRREKSPPHPRENLGGKYMSGRAGFREHFTHGGKSAKERVQHTASFIKESYSGSRALKILAREALTDRKESRTRENTAFLKESMRESFTHLGGRVQAPGTAPAPGAVNIGTVYIEGAQIRDFESFKRELSSAVEDL